MEAVTDLDWDRLEKVRITGYIFNVFLRNECTDSICLYCRPMGVLFGDTHYLEESGKRVARQGTEKQVRDRMCQCILQTSTKILCSPLLSHAKKTWHYAFRHICVCRVLKLGGRGLPSVAQQAEVQASLHSQTHVHTHSIIPDWNQFLYKCDCTDCSVTVSWQVKKIIRHDNCWHLNILTLNYHTYAWKYYCKCLCDTK